METVNSDIVNFVTCNTIRNYKADVPFYTPTGIGYDESNFGNGMACEVNFGFGVARGMDSYSNGARCESLDGSGTGYGNAVKGSSGNGWDRGIVKDDTILEFNGYKVYTIDSLATIIYSVKENIARGAILNPDLTTTDCYLARVENYFAHGTTVKQAFQEAYAKWKATSPIKERIVDFIKAHPALDVPYDDLFSWHHILTGSCSFGRLAWCKQHGYKPTDSITVRTFITQTKDAYGSEVIKQLAEYYNIKL